MGKNLEDYVYVCPHCTNVVDNCICDELPYSLVRLGRNIWPSIKVLDEKWYITESSIEDSEQICINFLKDNEFLRAIPEGFTQRGCVLFANIDGITEEERRLNKEKLLDKLYAWACSLPDRNPKNLLYNLFSF